MHAAFGKTFRASEIHQIKHRVFSAITNMQFLVQLINRDRGVKKIFRSHFFAFFGPIFYLNAKYSMRARGMIVYICLPVMSIFLTH